MWDRIGKGCKQSLLCGIGLMLATALAAPAWAQDDDEDEPGLFERTGLYLTGMATYIIPAEKGDLEGEANRRLNGIFGPGTRTDVDNAWGFNGRVGYRLHKHVAVETQFEWVNAIELDSQVAGVGAEQKTEINLWSLTGNAKGYLLTGRFQPYAVAGAGWGRSRTDFPGSGANRRDDGFVYRFGGGFDVYGSPDIALTVEGSYVIPEGNLDDLEYFGISAGLTLRFYPLE